MRTRALTSTYALTPPIGGQVKSVSMEILDPEDDKFKWIITPLNGVPINVPTGTSSSGDDPSGGGTGSGDDDDDDPLSLVTANASRPTKVANASNGRKTKTLTSVKDECRHHHQRPRPKDDHHSDTNGYVNGHCHFGSFDG